MDQLIERISSLVRKGNDLFQQERPVQYGVLGGYLVLWLLISGSLTQTLLVFPEESWMKHCQEVVE